MARKMCSFCGKRDWKRQLENYMGNGLFHEECFELHIAYAMRFEDEMDLFRQRMQ